MLKKRKTMTTNRYPYSTGYKYRGKRKEIYKSYSKAAVNLRYRVLALKYKTAYLSWDTPLDVIITKVFRSAKYIKKFQDMINAETPILARIKRDSCIAGQSITEELEYK